MIPARLGYSARWNEPGGFLYDIKGRLRYTAKVVIILTVVAVSLQVAWMGVLFLDVISDDVITNFISMAIFFTLLTNIVAWAFVNLTWKYARDSQAALDEYSEDLEARMAEFGMTLADLNEIGQAIKQSNLNAESVRHLIQDARVLISEVEDAGITREDMHNFIQMIPKLKKAAGTETRLTEGDFDVFSQGGQMSNDEQG